MLFLSRSALALEGTLAPTSVTVMCQLIECEWLRRTSIVLDDELSSTYGIAEIVNAYKVSNNWFMLWIMNGPRPVDNAI